eukprot:CAMPEP_0115039386 /NCGR_PEP_ID=MMETSP0216-20121206/43998_1 /TAXON_ID=223996 /ORGANISM="Protocruzia adherens, Strain Boccale" /LENGTH=1374 /DNA_ID=CAMNT_0002420017 /DNA_START=19 /DNA_END=4143 /DNA_ORIENTATION=-
MNPKDQTPLPALSTRYVFGLKSDVKHNIFHISDTKLCYIAGHQLVVYSAEEQKSQQFFPGLEGSLGITAMAIHPNKKQVAVAEKAERAVVIVHNIETQKKKVLALNGSESSAQEISSMAFAPFADKNYLVTLMAAECLVVYWQWDKQRVIAHTKIQGVSTMNEISINPLDHSSILCVGNGSVKYFRQIENGMKLLNNVMNKKDQNTSNNYTCHAFLSDGKIIVGTEAGELLLLDNSGEYKQCLSSSPFDGWGIECIVPWSKGFIVGGDNATLYIYERNTEDPKNPYQRVMRSLQVKTANNNPIDAKIKGISISPSEDMIVCTLENNLMYQSLFQIDRIGEVENSFELVSYDFHSQAIKGLDVCVRKPLLVTCSTDKTVRIWNYLDKTLEISQNFSEEAYCVGFHPSGCHIVVGFADKLRMMNVLSDSIKTFKDIHQKSCKEVKFAHGGHKFAAVHSTWIQIYNFYTGEAPHHLGRNHTAKIRGICWTEDDQSIITAGWDGFIYIYNIHTGVAERQFQEKAVNFSSVLITLDKKSILAVGSDKCLREFGEKDQKKTMDTGYTVGQVCMAQSQKMVFAAMAEPDRPGSIRVYRYPLTGEYYEYQAHSAPIERIALTYDDQYMFSVGQDGVLIMHDIKDKEGRGPKREKEATPLAFSDEFLVPKHKLDQASNEILSLKNELDNLNRQNDHGFAVLTKEKDAIIVKLQEDIRANNEQDKIKYERLRDEKHELELTYKEKMRKMNEDHDKAVGKTEKDYAQRISTEKQRYKELYDEKLEAKAQFEHKQMKIKTEDDRMKAALRSKHASELRAIKGDSERIAVEKDDLYEKHKSKREKIEDQYEKEIDMIKEKNAEEIQKNKQAGEEHKSKKTMMTKSFDQLGTVVKKKEIRIKDLKKHIGQKQEEIDTARKDIVSQLKEIQERDKTIADKDKRIQELKKKTQELEKFKFVLDYKIKELKKDINPREEEIAKMKEQTSNMDAELRHFTRVNNSLKLIVDDYKMKQDGMQVEINKLKQKMREDGNVIKKQRDDIYEAAQYLEDFKSLKSGILKLYHKYVQKDGAQLEVDFDIQKEYANQRKYLENTVDGFKKKLAKDADVHRQDNMRIMKENVELLKEINDLRREYKLMINNQKLEVLEMGTRSGSRSFKASVRSTGSSITPKPPQSGNRQIKDEMSHNKAEIMAMRNEIMRLEDLLGEPQDHDHDGELYQADIDGSQDYREYMREDRDDQPGDRQADGEDIDGDENFQEYKGVYQDGDHTGVVADDDGAQVDGQAEIVVDEEDQRQEHGDQEGEQDGAQVEVEADDDGDEGHQQEGEAANEEEEEEKVMVGEDGDREGDHEGHDDEVEGEGQEEDHVRLEGEEADEIEGEEGANQDTGAA